MVYLCVNNLTPFIGYEPAMFTHSPESQLHPGLHQKDRVQQFEGGDFAPQIW